MACIPNWIDHTNIKKNTTQKQTKKDPTEFEIHFNKVMCGLWCWVFFVLKA